MLSNASEAGVVTTNDAAEFVGWTDIARPPTHVGSGQASSLHAHDLPLTSCMSRRPASSTYTTVTD